MNLVRFIHEIAGGNGISTTEIKFAGHIGQQLYFGHTETKNNALQFSILLYRQKLRELVSFLVGVGEKTVITSKI